MHRSGLFLVIKAAPSAHKFQIGIFNTLNEKKKRCFLSTTSSVRERDHGT